MRRLLIAMMLSLASLAACDVDVTIRRGDKAPTDAGPLAEVPDPVPVAGPAVPESKPAPKDTSLKRKAGDLWNRVEDGGKELARDAEEKGAELRKDADALIKDAKSVDVDVNAKKDLSPKSWIAKIPWWGWVVIGLVVLLVLAAIFDILEDLFEGILKLFEVLVKLLIAAFSAVVGGVAKLVGALRSKPRRNREARVILIDDTISSGGTAPPPSDRRPPGRPDGAEQRRRGSAPQTASAPQRNDSDDSRPGVIATVGGAVAGAAEAVGETIGDIAESVGDIDIDLD